MLFPAIDCLNMLFPMEMWEHEAMLATVENFGLTGSARFTTMQAGPSRTLHHGLQAVRRGDPAIVLIAHRRSERAAILAEITRLAGPDLRRTVRIDGGELARGLTGRLAALALAPAPAAHRAAASRRADGHPAGRARTLLVIDEAELLGTSEIAALVDLRDIHSGGAVQVLLAGSNHLFVSLCRPQCDRFWRQVRLALTMDETVGPSAAADLSQLHSQIARTQARLEAQQRILSIFADQTAPAPQLSN